jgi:thiamine pyrophosphate-dependent acetolactate synthase large subunit-like protein
MRYCRQHCGEIASAPAELSRNYPAELPILGCARASLEHMNQLARGRKPASRDAWFSRLQRGRDVWREYQGRLPALPI